MKTRYFKNLCSILIVVLFVLLQQQAKATTATALSQKTSAGPGDTSRFQKPGRLKRAKKIKKDEDENEDGVSDDIRARAHQEFLQRRDPKLNRVPVERLLTARQKRDQFLNDVKVRLKNARPQGNVNKPLGNAPAAPPSSPPTISNLQWHERGPNNVGGRTRALIFDMGDAVNGYKRVFAGGVGGGLWITSDITATPVQWTKVNDFFDNIAISCIAQNPVNPKEIYVGTGEGFYNVDAIQGLGVWKSSDGGATWTHLPSTVGFQYVNAILVDRNGSVYVAGESAPLVGFGVDQSTDGGNTWTNVISSSEAGADLQMAANGDVYASTGVISLNGHIYISDYTVNGAHAGNAGTWTNITPASNGVITPATTSWNRIKLATAPSDANIVYAFFEIDYWSSDGKTNLAAVQQYNKSTNTWTVKTVPTEAFSNGQAWYSIAAAVDPNNPGVLYAGSLDAEKSVDGGQTWTRYSVWSAATTASNYVHADHHPYVYAPGSSDRLLMGTDGGVFYTVNASGTPSFVNKNNGYDVTQFYSVALHPTNFNYALAGAQDNGSEKLQGAGIGSSTTATGGDGADVFIDQTNGNIQITSYVFDQYYVSTDNGVTFNGLGSYGNGQFINPADYDPATKSIYAGSASGDYFRAENVLSPAYNEVFVSGFNSANVTAVTVSPLTANRVYFGLDNGSVVRVDNAQTGTSLTGVTLLPSPGSNITTSCINVDPTNEDHILVTYSNYGVPHVAETKNASAATPTWTDVTGNLPDMPVRWSLFYPGDPTKAIIATELGVWTTDLINGSSTVWDPTNTGLANVEVDMLKYRAADKTLAAATHGRGVFTSSLLNTDATLANLATSSGTLTPAFSSGTTAYTESVDNTVTATTVTPTTTDTNAKVTVNGVAVSSGTASHSIPLAVGPNTITTDVTAQDGVTTQTYTVTITRAASSNAILSSLALSSGTLTPSFVSTTTSYTASVANTITSITVTPKTSVATSTVTVNGIAVNSGTASGAIALNVGSNTITTLVTAQNGTNTKSYKVTVTRAASNIATLSNLAISAGTLSPAFATGTMAYTASVDNTVTATTATPTVTDVTATVTVNGVTVSSGTASHSIPLAVGPNTITTGVTAQDGVTTQTYTVTITRAASSNATLSGLGLSSGTLTPAFVSTTTSYTASVANTATSITVTPKTGVPTSTVTVNGTAVTSGTASGAIALNVGSNIITTLVTAQNGTNTKSYKVTITRAASSNATLSSLALSSGTLTPSFVSTTTSYTASVANTVTSVKVTPKTGVPTSTVTVNGIAVTSGTASGAIALNVGSNIITTLVTAQNGTNTKSYKVTITRAASSIATLSNLAISAGALSPAFATGTMAYTASVDNTVTATTATPTVTDATATVTVNGVTVSSGTASHSIPLAVGPNTITTGVTAQDGVTTQTYTVTITRAASSNATLSGLGLSSGTLTPSFVSTTTSYTASVANTVTSITVTPKTGVPTSTVTVNGTAVTSGTASGAIALNVGSNIITTVVTAQNGTNTKNYKVTVTRAAGGADSYVPGVSVTKPTETPQIADDGIQVHLGLSPNGDGINDFLRIDNISQYPDNKLMIMNRNGQLIYEASGYDNSSKVFDGHSNKNGQMQLPGTYFYQLDYAVNGITKRRTGFIVLKY